MKLDLADALGLVGLLLLAVAVGVTWGWPGLVGMVGGLLLVISVVMAWRRGQAQ
jgi:hypothetical protein